MPLPTPTPRRFLQLLALTAIFLTASLGAWAWFHFNPRSYPVSFRFEIRTNLAGYTFNPEPISSEAIEILSTTNVFNGAFLRDHRDRFTVFAGEWLGRNAREMSVVQHTPDICWVSAGAKPVDLGQPETTEIDFDGEKITFECRVFKMGADSPPELTIWCALASGQVITEGGRFSGSSENEWERKSTMMHFNRIRSLNVFLQAVKRRIPSDGSKQFARLSTSVDGDWRISLARLKDFTRNWIKVELKKSPTGS